MTTQDAINQIAKALEFDKTGEDTTCARCSNPVEVEDGREWEDGDICHICAHEVLLGVVSLANTLSNKP